MSQPTHINPQTKTKKNKDLPNKILDFASSMLIGVICLVTLGLLVWFSTLEQSEVGLKATLDKYYSYKALVVTPELGGKMVFFPLPGAYWVCAILFVNLFIGGILRIRKGVKQIGIITAHMGIIMLLVVGMIDHHKSVHGLMHTTQTGTYDYAFRQDASSIEVFAYTSKDQQKTAPYVIKHEMLADIGNESMRVFKIKGFPFDLEVRNFMLNANVYETSKNRHTQKDLAEIDGFFLKQAPIDPVTDLHNYGCYITIAPHSKGPKQTILLSRQIGSPQTFTVDGTLYGIEMPNEIWKMPFDVKLLDSKGEYFPGTSRPKYFSSDIAWKDDEGINNMRKIEMNEPLRHKGYTLYQAQWRPPVNDVKHSTFEVVTNPADEWPVYCLLISGLGLCIHFGIMFFNFISREVNNQKKEVISE